MILKKILFKFAGYLIKAKLRITKPFSIGVRALVVNDQDQVLLVKHSYSDAWYLPGGGVNKKEHLIDGLKRELYEELQLTINDEPVLLGTYSSFFEHKSDFSSVFIIRDFDINPTDNFEIDKWGFFNFQDLPEKISPGTFRRLEEFQQNKAINYRW